MNIAESDSIPFCLPFPSILTRNVNVNTLTRFAIEIVIFYRCAVFCNNFSPFFSGN